MEAHLLIRPKAIEDITAHAFFIAEDSSAEAERFMTDVEASFRLLAETPGIGSPRAFPSPHLEGLRIWPIRNHAKHLIFYIPRRDDVDIIRVLHSARDLLTLLGRWG